jgi:VIT1/CCC1 family predicted Fe2+/Mn2+ transporter
MTTCQICGCEWPAPPTRCVCGYDFETGNTREAIRSLTIQQRSASRRWLGGLVMFASSIVTLVLATFYPAMWLAVPIILAVQVLFGLGLISTGLHSGIKINRQLSRAKTMNQLPAARLLK